MLWKLLIVFFALFDFLWPKPEPEPEPIMFVICDQARPAGVCSEGVCYRLTEFGTLEEIEYPERVG